MDTTRLLDTLFWDKSIDGVSVDPANGLVYCNSSKESKIWIWDQNQLVNAIEKGEEITDFVTNSIDIDSSLLVYAIRLSEDGKCMAIIFDNNTVEIFDWRKNQSIAKLKGHTNTIEDVEFSKDGNYLLTGSSDNTYRLWDVSGKELIVYNSHKKPVNGVMFSRDGNYVYSISDDFTARVMPTSIEAMLDKINNQKVRGDFYQLTEKDKQTFGISK
jgi:WD40 repeat protein